jgi:hypothetical protein
VLLPAVAVDDDTSFVTVTSAGVVSFVVVVSVGHVVSEPDGEHPGPDHCAVFETLPVASASTVTANDSVTADPGVTPAPIVHVISFPDTCTEHDGVELRDPHEADPLTSAVPAGTVSVTTTGAIDVDAPTLVATSV